MTSVRQMSTCPHDLKGVVLGLDHQPGWASLLLDLMDGIPRPIRHINLTPKLIARATS
jgi:hypothetical protein